MGFAQGSTYKAETKLLEEGIYEAKIVDANECILKGWNALLIKLLIAGYEDYKPNEYVVFDPMGAQDEKSRKSNEKRLSRLLDATEMYLDADGVDIKKFVGKKVKVEVKKDKKGFMNISKIMHPQKVQELLTY